jgi:hypothetical protein
VLLDTATGAALQLAVRGSGFSTDPWPVLYDGMFRATMNAEATRFLYLARGAKDLLQLATLDLNPGSLGDAPAIAEAKVTPEFVLLDGRSTATVSARVTTGQQLIRVSAVALTDGLWDRNVASPVILDEGSGGDAAAKDGIFTSNGLYANCCAIVGPHTVRIKAETIGADGRRHATAVEIGPFEVRK